MLQNVRRFRQLKYDFAKSRPGAHLNIKTVFSGMRISIIKIRYSWECVIFIVGFTSPVRQHPYIVAIARVYHFLFRTSLLLL